MSAFLNLGSLVLGLISWIIPIVAISQYQKRKNVFSFSIISFSACALSLVLQIFEIKHRVHVEDWSALMDTIDVLSWVVVVLVVITIVLNVVGLNICKKSNHTRTVLKKL